MRGGDLQWLRAVSTASAATTEAPTGPPWDAFTIEGTGGGVSDWAVYDWTPANSDWFFVPASGWFHAVDNTAEPSEHHWWDANVAPPSGQQFVAGTTYPTLRFADSTHAQLEVYGDGRAAPGFGSLRVLEATYAEGVLTAFAADYEQHCDSASDPATYGSLRWHSTRTSPDWLRK